MSTVNLCRWCNGYGNIPQATPEGSTFIECPICKGSGQEPDDYEVTDE